MNGEILLDTNIVIELLNGDEETTIFISTVDEVHIPAVVIGELFFGAFKSSQPEKNLKQIEELIDQNSILSCDQLTAFYYGRIKNFLRAKGRPLPENDIWIAALCSQHNFSLVTRDKHFQEIEEIQLAQWT